MKRETQKDKTTIATTSTTENITHRDSMKDKINLDYDWNSEYGDGDIPEIDK